MEFDKGKFSFAAALTVGIVYVVCALVVVAAPDVAFTLLGWIAHLVNVEKFAADVAVTATGFIGGLAQTVVYSYVIAWLFAWLYNWSVKRG